MTKDEHIQSLIGALRWAMESKEWGLGDPTDDPEGTFGHDACWERIDKHDEECKAAGVPLAIESWRGTWRNGPNGPRTIPNTDAIKCGIEGRDMEVDGWTWVRGHWRKRNNNEGGE